ncbi:hypothetical protein [Vibrio splendidus]|uniref:hypothetical protein n=1 Tax=Vibrio splendidus TaxID=29497 RepID=UPI000D35C90E|nr:hypothetical protein [Vibrio splendidus]MDH5889006.1 hypothetical protein [Vibrio splendidus]PTP89465.1 hypothetical protein CWO03_08245 [Vibrio splendidus]
MEKIGWSTPELVLRDLEQDLQLLVDILAQTEDFETIVLKYHLGFERLLDYFLENMFFNGEAFEKAKLSFHQKSCFFDAVYGKGNDKVYSSLIVWLYDFNRLRNELTHRLSSERHKKLCKKLKVNYMSDKDHTVAAATIEQLREVCNKKYITLASIILSTVTEQRKLQRNL